MKRWGITLKKVCSGVVLIGTLTASCASEEGIDTAGDVVSVMLPLASVATTYYRDDSQGRYQFAAGFAFDVTVTYGLKYVVHKARPDGSDDNAFPSSHTSVSFHSAGFLHRRYGIEYAAAAYAAAAFVGYSRIAAKKHDASDVVSGALTGLFSAWLFTDAEDDLTMTAFFMKDTYGCQICYRW